MEDTLDELSAVIENQVVMATVRNSVCHDFFHRCGLVSCYRYVKVGMWSYFTIISMRLDIIFRCSGGSLEEALPPRNVWISC